MDSLTVNIVDMSMPPKSDINIAVINQPNPVTGYTATPDELLDLFAISKYKITETATGKPVTGDNFYEYFPDLDPSHGGGGGGGATILSGDTDPSSSEGNDGDLYMKTTDVSIESVTVDNHQRIQVDYFMNKDSVVELDCMLSAPTNTYDTHLGSRAGSVDHFLAYDGGTLRYAYDGASGNIGSITSCYDKRTLFTFSRTQVKVECDGSVVYDTAINGGNTTSTTKIGFFSLFTDSNGNDNSMTRTNGTFYGCKIYENGTLVKNFVPYKDTNGKYCIRETITGLNYLPIGGDITGTETQGDDIVANPYLKVDGEWQDLIGSRLEDINTEGGGGGGGSTDYNDLSNKPSINSVTLQGNVTDTDLGIQNCYYDNATDEIYTVVDGVRAVLITNAKRHALIPVMTDFDKPSGLVENGNSYGGSGTIGTESPLLAFDGNDATNVGYVNENVGDGWLSYTFPNECYVENITARFGNWRSTNDITATLFVYDKDGVETELETVHVTGIGNRGASALFDFTVRQRIMKFKFVYGYKQDATNVYTHEIQAYGYVTG